MTSIARYERTRLADLAEELGPDAPTLCDGWTVRDLVVHLLVRERSPAAAGILVRPLSGVLDTVSARHARRDFATLVEELREGPPVWSPFAIPKLGDALNTLEYFVHHEDVRRANGLPARDDLPELQDALWGMLRRGARLQLRKVRGVGVELARPGRASFLAKRGEPVARIVGDPAELVLFLFGRGDAARVSLEGDPAAIAALEAADLGL